MTNNEKLEYVNGEIKKLMDFCTKNDFEGGFTAVVTAERIESIETQITTHFNSGPLTSYRHMESLSEARDGISKDASSSISAALEYATRSVSEKTPNILDMTEELKN